MGDTHIINPVLRGMYPDPSWIWDSDNERAVITCSSFTMVPGLPLHASGDLGTWALVGHAVDEAMSRRLLLDYAADSGGLFAPTLRKIGGKYVIACSSEYIDHERALADGVDTEVLLQIDGSDGNFVIEADSLDGPWRGPFWVRGAHGIDPDLFEDADGTVWWSQTRPALDPQWEGQTEVWCAMIDPDNWQLVEGKGRDGDSWLRTVLWRGYGRCAVWAEAPHLLRRGDWIYLITAEGGTSFDHSEMAMRTYAPQGLRMAIRGYLDDATQAGEGEYARYCGTSMLGRDERCALGTHHRLFEGWKKNPMITHRHLGNASEVQCVGHGDLMAMPDGTWWLACLGVRELPGNCGECYSYLGRETFIAPVDWQHDPVTWKLEGDGKPCDDGDMADPGWPLVNPGYGRLPMRMTLDSAGSVQSQCMRDCGMDAQELVLPAMLDDPAADTVRVGACPGRRFLRLSSTDCSIVASLGSGVMLYQDSRNNLRFAVDGDDIIAERREQGEVTRQVLAPLHDLRVIGVRIRDNGISWYLQGGSDPFEGPESGRCDARFLSSEWAGGFVGCLVGC